jgi:Ca2+-binding EF-hand superfamily protein
MIGTWFGRLTATAAMGLAATTWAQDGRELFEKLDKNKDGYVSGDEVEGEGKALFERLAREGDKDGDKRLSREEIAAALQGRRRESDGPAGS